MHKRVFSKNKAYEIIKMDKRLVPYIEMLNDDNVKCVIEEPYLSRHFFAI